MPSRTQSPLKHKPDPLPVPGESLQFRLNESYWSRCAFWIAAVSVTWTLAFSDWWHWHTRQLTPPFYGASIAALVTVVGAIRLSYSWHHWRAMRRGLFGERYVGQRFEELRLRGFDVLHDLPGVDSNVDHVLVGPEGVFAVETKYWYKPAEGNKTAFYDGNEIQLPSGRYADPVVQARAAADQVKRLLRETTGRDVPVRPVVVMAGWYVVQRVRSPDVWVINEEMINAYLDHEQPRLSPEDIRLYSSRIADELRRRHAS